MMGAIGVILCILFYHFYNEWRDKKEYRDWKKEQQEKERLQSNDDVNKHLYNEATAQTEKDNNANIAMENKGTRELFLETLTKIGCQYELSEEENDERIYFAYQGEYFFVLATDENKYIHIYDTNWGHVELYDIDEFTRLKKAINESNLRNAVTTVYTIDEAGNNVNVHCKTTILLVPQIPQIENYLREVLNAFFSAHQCVGSEMTKLRESEEAI